MEMTSFTPKAFLLDTNQKSKFSFHYLIRTQGLRALTIRASNPQNTLIQISFHSPKCLPCPNHSLIMIMHAVTMAGQLAISLKTSSSCSSHTPLNHGQLWVFFSFFSSSTTFGTPKIYIHILARNHFTFSNLPEEHALIKNKSLAMSLSTWQTEGYYLNEKF